MNSNTNHEVSDYNQSSQKQANPFGYNLFEKQLNTQVTVHKLYNLYDRW